jgi:hypothetical protein
LLHVHVCEKHIATTCGLIGLLGHEIVIVVLWSLVHIQVSKKIVVVHSWCLCLCVGGGWASEEEGAVSNKAAIVDWGNDLLLLWWSLLLLSRGTQKVEKISLLVDLLLLGLRRHSWL